MKILLTTTSYQDCPGDHHALLASTGAEIVRERGPLSEEHMLELAGDFDAFLCGDDEITQAVIDASLPKLKIIAKYGIGVDKIDVSYATEKRIPVSFCPGVNHTTVAEHVFMLLLALNKNLMEQANTTASGGWKRMTGHEIMGKTIGIIGLGRIGREVAPMPLVCPASAMISIGQRSLLRKTGSNARPVLRRCLRRAILFPSTPT
jgi:D-3-phosphoglycerate dehydrogenase